MKRESEHREENYGLASIVGSHGSPAPKFLCGEGFRFCHPSPRMLNSLLFVITQTAVPRLELAAGFDHPGHADTIPDFADTSQNGLAARDKLV